MENLLSPLICLQCCIESEFEDDLRRIQSTLKKRPFLDDSFLNVFWLNYTEVKEQEVQKRFQMFERNVILSEIVDEVIGRACQKGHHETQSLYINIRFRGYTIYHILRERILAFCVILLGIRLQNRTTDILE